MTKEYSGGKTDNGLRKGDDGFSKVQSHKATFNDGEECSVQVGRKTDEPAPSRGNK